MTVTFDILLTKVIMTGWNVLVFYWCFSCGNIIIKEQYSTVQDVDFNWKDLLSFALIGLLGSGFLITLCFGYYQGDEDINQVIADYILGWIAFLCSYFALLFKRTKLGEPGDYI